MAAVSLTVSIHSGMKNQKASVNVKDEGLI